MKLWKKNMDSLNEVDKFTVGNDRNFDLQLAPFDVLGSLAHIKMLSSVGLLEKEETVLLEKELKSIYNQISAGDFSLSSEVEDIHSQIELMLTNSLGESGKKIHSARSRNDQVLVDVKLFLRKQIELLVNDVWILFELLQQKSEEHKSDLMPGYTHFQLAMPSSFGLWFGAFAESLVDDMQVMLSAYKVANKNPLGSAAGYGSSFPINRKMTTELLGFDDLNYNVVYAQMTRGKSEKIMAQAMANVAYTLSKLSSDACIFLNQHFGFISFPDELTTGSSIMPHKKNPDVFELIRAHCNRIQSVPNEIAMLTTNLPSGYHRDLQLLKEILFPAIKNLHDCIQMAILMIQHISIKNDIVNDEQFKYLFTVEEMNKLVLQGIPLRDAYKNIGEQVESGNFSTDYKVNHVHEGSMGNLQTKQIRNKMTEVMSAFDFKKANAAIDKLLL